MSNLDFEWLVSHMERISEEQIQTMVRECGFKDLETQEKDLGNAAGSSLP